MRQHLLLVGGVVLLALLCTPSAANSCIFSLPGVEGVYDLRSIANKPFIAFSSHPAYAFHFSVCGAVPICNSYQNASVCQNWEGGEANCGVWDPAEPDVGPIPAPGVPGIMINVRDGEEGRFSKILIHCDPTATTPKNLTAKAAVTLFSPYVVELTSSAGCPTTLPPDTPFTPTAPFTAPVPLTPPDWVPLPPFAPEPIAEPISEPQPTPVPEAVPQIIPETLPPITEPITPPITPISPPTEPPTSPPITPITPITPVTPPAPTPKSSPLSPSKPPKKLSVGSILLIILACLIPVYIIVGVIINCLRGKEGSEVFPNKAFWVGLPSLLGDGAKFLARPCSSGSSSYEMLPK